MIVLVFYMLLLTFTLCYSQACATNMAQCGIGLVLWSTCQCATVSETDCLNCLVQNGISSNSITCLVSANTQGMINITKLLLFN